MATFSLLDGYFVDTLGVQRAEGGAEIKRSKNKLIRETEGKTCKHTKNTKEGKWRHVVFVESRGSSITPSQTLPHHLNMQPKISLSSRLTLNPPKWCCPIEPVCSWTTMPGMLVVGISCRPHLLSCRAQRAQCSLCNLDV